MTFYQQKRSLLFNDNAASNIHFGAKVVVYYGGSEDAAKEVVSKIEEKNGIAIALQANLSKSADVTKLFEQTEQQLGKPDIIVNFAGTSDVGKLSDMDEAAFDKVFGLNNEKI